MFKKGNRCFHPDYGNGLILRVNKQNIAKIQFDGEQDVVWLKVENLDDALPEDEAADYLAHLKASAKADRAGISREERLGIRREARKQAKGFEIPGVAEKLAQKAAESSADEASDENDCEQPALTPVYPISLREMPIPAPNIQTFCEKFSQCVSAEIFESRSRFKVRRMLIHHAERLQENAESVVYAIELDSDAFYPEGSEVIIWRTRTSEKFMAKAVVAACDGPMMFVELNTEISEDLSGMYYSVDEAALLEALNDRLQEIAEKPASPILSDLILNPHRYVQNCAISSGRLGQLHALESALNAPITFIWGPPGTGKTETLARIVMEHLGLGHRILMVSQCNVSVDAAILRVRKLDVEPVWGRCVRYGYPRDPELVDNSNLTVSMMALMKNHDQYNNRTQMMRELKKTPHTDPRYLELRKELESLSMAMMQEEKAIVRHAKFVATTVSKAIIDSSLYKDEFDVVLFDEASMALIPQIAFSASIAKKHFICAGDFSQLPPIIHAYQSALEADIFYYTGISNAVYQNRSHAWLYLLDEQYRMHEKIAEFAGKFMYRGLLKSAPIVKEREEIAQIRPVSGEAIVLLNLRGSHIKPVDSSKINLLSALMIFGVALNILAQNYDPGIITPYSPQARLIRCMAKDFALYRNRSDRIACSTVHQFQGSEKDVILYDIVEMERPGIMLSRNDNQYANRLFNVAMTRARGKLCIMADKEFVCTKMASNLMLSALVHNYYNHCVNIRKQFEASMNSISSQIMRVFSGETLMHELAEDIDNSTSSLHFLVSLEMLSIFENARLFSKMIERHKELKLKLTLCVPQPERYGIASVFFKAVQSNETLMLIDKQRLWYFYMQETGVMTGIRWVGMHTVRRVKAIYFNA